MRGSSDSGSRSDMRVRIKATATDLLIRKGFRGTSYGDIASSLKITTTNIHYHFGPKQRLVAEVVREYVDATLVNHKRIWLHPDASLAQKLVSVVAYNNERYRKFNRGGTGGRPWSLIGRLRLDADVLSEPAKAALSDFTTQLHGFVLDAVKSARDKGELRAESPVDDIAFLITNMVTTSATFTQDTGSFQSLADLFQVVSRLLTSAYAPQSSRMR